MPTQKKSSGRKEPTIKRLRLQWQKRVNPDEIRMESVIKLFAKLDEIRDRMLVELYENNQR